MTGELHNLSSDKKKKKKRNNNNKKALWNIFWQLLQTALEECRERLNALKWVFLTFALLSHWNSTNSFFMFLTSCVNHAMGRKKSPATNWRYGKAVAVRAAAFWGGAQVWRPLEWGKKTVFLHCFQQQAGYGTQCFFLRAISVRSVFCLWWCISAQTAHC